MIWKNVEIFNIAELIELPDGAVTWRRVPEAVEKTLERGAQSLRYSRGFTGVELRFVLKGEKAVIRLAKEQDDGVDNSFQIFRGGFQGPYGDYAKSKVLNTMEPRDIEITHVANPERLALMAQKCDLGWDPNVIRVRFDRGQYKILDIIGDVEPPKPEQTPQKTLMVYGSSISVGMDSQTVTMAWPSHVAFRMGMDLRNMSFAGSCVMEPLVCDYLGDLGTQGKWDMAILELGINATSFEPEKVEQRSRYILEQVAGRNPQKPVFVVSPFHSPSDLMETGKTQIWRDTLSRIIGEGTWPNVTYINGMDILPDVSWFTGDGLHPSAYGQVRIAEGIYERIINYKL